ncbi:Nramp-domain-containing protein [Phellopilus nigrolimitatus]|nr:Nramp-domain-containing protein [Phellopilus nigrolimitatus]
MHSHSQQQNPDELDSSSRVNSIRNAFKTFVHHMKTHAGVGIICAVAYFDPGNWSTDLLAGSQFGYKLLFILLMSGLGAVVLQALSCKLGCVTGLDLATHCRLLLHDHPRFPKLARYCFLYPLYVLSELAIISTDLAELLGSAIALVLIFPKLPLPVAVLLTALDVIFILAVGDPSRSPGRSSRVFELVIISLVFVVFISFAILLAEVKPYWPDAFDGFLPSRTIIEPDALFAAVGILGATVMPHALYLGSHLATNDRVSTAPVGVPLALPNSTPSLSRRAVFKKMLKSLFSAGHVERDEGENHPDISTPHGQRSNNSLSFIKAHLKHGVWDIVLSLLGFAVVINASILIIAGAVFFYGPGQTAGNTPAGLFDAFDLIASFIGKPAAIIFAIALLCSGQSASITATLAGQIVSEGFIQWKVSPFLRRLLTRCLGLIPAMVVAVVVGRDGINTLLVISQVVLSIVLPFVVFPLVWLTSSPLVMRVRRPRELASEMYGKNGETSNMGSTSDIALKKDLPLEGLDGGEGIRVLGIEIGRVSTQDSSRYTSSEENTEEDMSEKDKGRAVDVSYLEAAGLSSSADPLAGEYVDYSNGWPLTIVAYAIWGVVVIANGYLIVSTALGE